jgi:hypothetical protein
MSTVYTFVL